MDNRALFMDEQTQPIGAKASAISIAKLFVDFTKPSSEGLL